MISVVTKIKGGKVKTEVSGVKGDGCKDITKPLEDALGIVVSSTPTEEMFEHATANSTDSQSSEDQQRSY